MIRMYLIGTLCKGSCQPQRLTEGLPGWYSEMGRRSFLCSALAGQPLRHCVPPPLAQGRLEDFAACHLPLHRGGWKILLRVTFPYTGETMEQSVKPGHSPQISPRNLSSSILELFTASSMANASASAASAPTALISAGTSPREKA